MKYKLLSLFFLSTLVGFGAERKVASYVNPFIGTSNFGVTQPGPVVPMGMVSMSPYNTIDMPGHKIHTDGGWCSTPFVYENRYVAGFTNVNLSGVGCPDFGSLLIMPTTGTLEVDAKKYCSELEAQQASPGYYKANIKKYGLTAEMTATTRTTRSRYTFPAGESNILFNIGTGLTNETGGYAKIVSDREIEGYKIMGTFCYGEPQSIIPIYFVVRVNKSSKVQYWKKQDQLKGARHDWDSFSGKYKIYNRYAREMSGDEIGVAFSFNTSEKEAVEISVGVSFVSIENARENLDKEQKNLSFEDIRNEAFNKWNDILSRIEVEGGTDDQKTVFYTALYHTYIHPNILQDVNGEYPAMATGETLTKDKGNRLTMFSGWDVYRINPGLMSIIDPARLRDMTSSLMDMYRESGNLPKFEVNSQEFMVMQGDPAVPFIVDSYFRGALKGMDVEEVYQAMIKNATTPQAENRVRPDLDFYDKNGYLPLQHPYDNSVSQALEYYIADWALAQMAKSLGKQSDYELLMRRALGYKKYFDPKYSLLRPVMPDGTFMDGFDPLQGENFAPVHGFHEGTSWNYSFYIPHDIKGLIELHGGPRKFTENLAHCFDEGLFDMTNEPDMGYPFYFSFVKGEQWRTQKLVRELLSKYFKNTPGGLPGNDDAGTMSTWCVFAMMGLYPPTPGADTFVITAPVFDKVTIKLDPEFYNKSELVIINNSKDSAKDTFVKSIKVGDKSFKGFIIDHKQLTESGKIVISCSDKH